MKLGAKRKQGNRHRRAGDRQRRLADPRKEANGDRDHRRDRAGRVVLGLELARVGRDQQRDRAQHDGGSDERMTEPCDQPGDPGTQPEHRKSPDTRDTRAGLLLPELPAALDADQQAAGERRPERERLMIPVRVQALCQTLDRQARIALDDLLLEHGRSPARHSCAVWTTR